MTVDSPLALFTTLFGWQFYNTIWDVLLGSGIALIPFVGVLIEVLVTDREDGNSIGDDPKYHFRRLEAQILLMLGVVAVGVQPANFAATSLGPNTLSYIPYPTLLEPEPVIATTTASGNTFGDTGLANFDDAIPVPVWWYAVMSLSQGVNRAVIEGFPKADSVRDLFRLAQIAHINDPALARETTEFYSECFIPARSAFLKEKPIGEDAEDVAFMGSDFYVEGAYKTLRSSIKVRGFPFDPERDRDLSPPPVNVLGKPTCEQWWLGGGAEGREGLREELLTAAEQTATGLEASFAGLLRNTPRFAEPEFAQNIVLKRLLSNSDIDFSNDSFRSLSSENAGGFFESFNSFLGRAANEVGLVMTSTVFALFIDIVTLGTPMMQPLLLMAVFALLPFVLVASRYSLSALVGGAIVIFTISFWPVLWYIATFMDDQLVKAMYPLDDGFLEDFDTKKMLLGMVASSLFVLLPIVFSAVMGIAGVRAVAATASLSRGLAGGGVGVERGSSGSQALGGAVASKVSGKIGNK